MGADDDDEFRFNNISTHKGHLCQNGILNKGAALKGENLLP